MSSQSLGLLIKRKVEFALFVYLTLVTTFLQADTAVICQLTVDLRRIANHLIPVAVLSFMLAASYAIVAGIFWYRFLLAKQALAAAAIHLVMFLAFALGGISARLWLAAAPLCGTTVIWPPDFAQAIAIACVTVVAASVFMAVLNIVAPQKADYAEARLRLDQYFAQIVAGTSLPSIREATQKAYDSLLKSLGGESSARYRQFVETELVDAMHELNELAKATTEGHPEEFLKRIGYREGITPPGDPRIGVKAQKQVERVWRRPKS